MACVLLNTRFKIATTAVFHQRLGTTPKSKVMEEKLNLERLLWYRGNDESRTDKRQLLAETPYDTHGSA
jgi:hypothetical protein